MYTKWSRPGIIATPGSDDVAEHARKEARELAMSRDDGTARPHEAHQCWHRQRPAMPQYRAHAALAVAAVASVTHAHGHITRRVSHSECTDLVERFGHAWPRPQLTATNAALSADNVSKFSWVVLEETSSKHTLALTNTT